MRKCLTIIISLLTAIIYGQENDYIPLPDSNVTWHFKNQLIGFAGTNTRYYPIIICGDTLINNKVYNKLMRDEEYCDESGTYYGGIRQDVLNKLVYYFPPTATEEYLLYDFNLEIGDTITGFLASSVGIEDIVESIDSVLIGGQYRKRWLINPDYSIYIIEGVGSTYGLVVPSPGRNLVDGEDYFLYCFQQNGEILYPDTASSCEYPDLDKLDMYLNNEPNVFPNPCKGSITIESKNKMIWKIYLYNALGQIIYSGNTDITGLTQIHTIEKGAYILTLVMSDDRIINHLIISSP